MLNCNSCGDSYESLNTNNICAHCVALDTVEAFDSLYSKMPPVEDMQCFNELGVVSSEKYFKRGDNYIVAQLTSIGGENKGYIKTYSSGTTEIIKRQEHRHEDDVAFLKIGSLDTIGNGVVFALNVFNGLIIRKSTKLLTIICTDSYALDNAVKVFKKAGATKLCVTCDNSTLYSAMMTAKYNNCKLFNSSESSFLDIFRSSGIRAVREQLKIRGGTSEIKKNDMNDMNIALIIPPKKLNNHVLQICDKLAKRSLIEYVYNDVKQLSLILEKRGVEFDIEGYIQESVSRIRAITADRNILSYNDAVFEVDCSELSNDEIASMMLEQGGIWLDNRGMGAGKTELMGCVASQVNVPVTYISHRVSLAKTGSERLNLRYYDSVDVPFETPKNLSVVVNSILKHSINENTDILFVDEFRQTLEHLLNGVVDSRLDIYNYLINSFNVSDLVVLSDADLNNTAVQWILQNTHNRRVRIITQADVKRVKKTIRLMPSHDTTLSVATRESLSQGCNVLIATDSIKIALRSKQHLINEGVNETDILLLTGENKGDSRQLAFFANPNEEAVKYRAVIHSPVISSGISIEVNHFTGVYAMFSGVLPENELLQTLGRCRKATDFFVSLESKNHTKLPTNILDLVDGEIIKRAHYNEQDASIVLSEFDVLRLNERIECNRSLNSFKERFVTLAATRGYEIVKLGGLTQPVLIKGLKQEVTELIVSSIELAQDITSAEHDTLKTRNALTQLESDSIRRFNVGLMTGNNINRDDIKFYLNDNGMSKLLRYEDTLKSSSDLIEADRVNHTMRNRLNSRSSTAFLFKEVVSLGLGKRFTAKDALTLCKILRARYTEILSNGLGDYSKLSSYPIKSLNTFVSQGGYSVVEAGKTNAIRHYTIVVDDRINNYALARKLKESE